MSAYGPRGGDSDQVVKAAQALIEGVAAEDPPVRVLVVNGAGSLEVSPGVQLLDTPDFPKAWKGFAVAHRDALAAFQASEVDWTCISPAHMIEPGKRTGRYRTALDQLVVDDKGESRISAEDFAVAVVDQIERRQFPRQRFAVGY